MGHDPPGIGATQRGCPHTQPHTSGVRVTGESSAARSRLSRSSVSRWGVLAQSLAIGPIFSAGFLSGTVAVFAGFNTPLSVLLAAVGTIALAYVLTVFGRRFAGAGAIYEYLTRGIHPSVGVIGTGAYLIGLLFLGAGGGFVGEGFFVNSLLSSELSVNLGWGVWALVALAAVITLNYVGVRIGIRAIVASATLSLVPFLIVAFTVIARGGIGGNTLGVFDPGQTSWNAVFHGILFAISLFIGFETVAALGEEAKMPRRSIPRAMITSIVLFAGFYLLVTYAGAIGFGKAGARTTWFASGNPFGLLGQRYVAHSLGWIINLTIVLDLFSVCLAFTLAASRVLMTLARDGLLPAPLSRTSRRFHTPIGGLATIAVWALIVTLWAALTHYGAATHTPDVLQAALILSASGSYLITFVYALLAAGGLWLVLVVEHRPRQLWWRLPVVLVALAVPVLSFDGSLNPFPAYPNDLGVYFAAASLLIAMVWFATLRVWRPGLVGAAAAYAEDEEGFAPVVANLAD